MNALRITTCLAANTDEFTAALAESLSDALARPVTVVNDLDWPTRYAQIGQGAIQLAWICGWPYVNLFQPTNVVMPIAGACFRGDCYAGQPVYFSVVVVRADSHVGQMTDLRGSRFAINEPGSLSGYHVMRGYLAEQAWGSGFFGHIHVSGGHVASLQQLLTGEVDAAAIDSTVYTWWRRTQPQDAPRVRVLETLGPHPVPPWVIHGSVPPALGRAVRTHLLDLHTTTAGHALLERADLQGFAPIDPNTYAAVEGLKQRAGQFTLGPHAL